jgi:peroxiredoxin
VTTTGSAPAVDAAEALWLRTWTAGPTENEGQPLPRGTRVPDLVLLDHAGAVRSLSQFWSDGPALLMFWRHFGCGCGVERAARLRQEWSAYQDAGLRPVVIGQGEPERAAAYRSEQGLPCPVLCDPERDAYRAFGIGQWSVARILYDAPARFWSHPSEAGAAFQDARRAAGRPLVDDPWRAAAEFVVGTDGTVVLPYAYQYCEDFPDPRVLTTAARLSRAADARQAA